MRYPPRLRMNADGRAYWDMAVGPDIDEVIPNASAPMFELIHFDLDTQNVLIGDFDNSNHKTVPIFKVSDFGLAKPMKDPLFKDPKRVWNRRRCGKTHYLLPEQFHKEWEYIDVLPQLEEPRPQVAGQYSAWSNIYAIALCMHLLITQTGPPNPPLAVGPLNHADGDSLFEKLTRFDNFWGARVRPFYTHGHLLEVQPGLDPELKGLLIRCLADIPRDRPTLEELDAWQRSKENLPDWDDPDDDATAWCDMMFRGAPYAPSSTAQAHPSLATTPPSATPPAPEISWDGKDPSGSRGPATPSKGSSDDNDNGGGGAALFSGQPQGPA